MKLEAKVNLLSNSTNNIKALASITIENCFVVTGIRIIETQKGFFCAMPSRKNANGEYKDICFPITAEARAAINDEILKVFYEKLSENRPETCNNNINNDYGFNDDELPF